MGRQLEDILSVAVDAVIGLCFPAGRAIVFSNGGHRQELRVYMLAFPTFTIIVVIISFIIIINLVVPLRRAPSSIMVNERSEWIRNMLSFESRLPYR